jgi:hypothetical protein
MDGRDALHDDAGYAREARLDVAERRVDRDIAD